MQKDNRYKELPSYNKSPVIKSRNETNVFLSKKEIPSNIKGWIVKIKSNTNKEDRFKLTGKYRRMLENKNIKCIQVSKYGVDLFVIDPNRVYTRQNFLIQNMEECEIEVTYSTIDMYNNKYLLEEVYLQYFRTLVYKVLEKKDFVKIANNHFIKNKDLISSKNYAPAYHVTSSIIKNRFALFVQEIKKILPRFDIQEIEERLKTERIIKVRTLPEMREGEMVGINHEYNDEKYSELKRYWKRKYNIELPESDKIVRIRFGQEKTYDYPLSTVVKPVTDRDRKNIMKNIDSCEVRLLHCKKFMKENLNRIKGKLMDIIFETNSVYKDLFDDFKIFKAPQQIECLKSNGESISLSWRETKLLLEKPNVVPLGGRKNIKVIIFYPPQRVKRDNIEKFEELLKSKYNKYGWGNLETITFAVNKGTQIKDFVESFRENLSKNFIQDTLILIISPYKYPNLKFYSKLKKNVFEQFTLPVQFIRYINIINENKLKKFIDSIISQIYIKITGKGLWRLSKPADDLGKTIYIAYDVSRVYKQKYGYSAYYVASDAKGEIIKSGNIPTPKEKITSETFHKIFSEIFERTQKQNIKFNRLIFFKDGKVYPEDIENFKEAIYNRNGQLCTIKNSLINNQNEKLTFALVSVQKSHPLRILEPEKGLMITLSMSSGLLYSADAPMGRFKNPLEITVESSIVIGNYTPTEVDITSICHEYYKLTFLNWLTPQRMKNYKYAIVQVLVQLSAKDMAEDIVPPEDYLDF